MLVQSAVSLVPRDTSSGCFKCSSKCDLCKNYFRESKIFRSCSIERFYDIRQHADCKSKNVVYLVTRNKCKVQYVGFTSNEVKVRFHNHKSAMSTKKTTCEVNLLSILTKRNIDYLTLNSF